MDALNSAGQSELQAPEVDLLGIPPAPYPSLVEATSADRWMELMYGQGSECCRNYSKLTMQVRTLAAAILAASAFGISSVIVQSISRGAASPQQLAGPVLTLGGSVLVVFAVMLWLVNWHYSTAFRAIRDCLAAMEQAKATVRAPLEVGTGVWGMHARVRTAMCDRVASDGPFVVLALLGLAAAGTGAYFWMK